MFNVPHITTISKFGFAVGKIMIYSHRMFGMNLEKLAQLCSGCIMLFSHFRIEPKLQKLIAHFDVCQELKNQFQKSIRDVPDAFDVIPGHTFPLIVLFSEEISNNVGIRKTG